MMPIGKYVFVVDPKVKNFDWSKIGQRIKSEKPKTENVKPKGKSKIFDGW